MRFTRSGMRGVSLGLASALAFAVAVPVYAGWGSYGGSWGGSSGGWGGSSGGSSGAYYAGYSGGSSGGYYGGSSGGYRNAYYGGSSGGSWGGGLFSRIHARVHAWRHSGGSSGGSWGSYGYHGSSGGSSGGYYHQSYYHGGSSGGSSGGISAGYYSGAYPSVGVYSSGTIVTESAPAERTESYRRSVDPAPALPPADAPMPDAADEAPAPPPADDASAQNQGRLLLRVPAEAVVRVNGFRTRSEGTIRRFITPTMAPGESFAYEFEIAVGDSVTKERIVLAPGDNRTLTYGERSSSNPVTTVKVVVPEGAAIYLAGAPTRATGRVRTFSTTELAAGKTWSDYTIRAVLKRDGRELVQERTLDLAAGDVKELSFDFADARLAIAD